MPLLPFEQVQEFADEPVLVFDVSVLVDYVVEPRPALLHLLVRFLQRTVPDREDTFPQRGGPLRFVAIAVMLQNRFAAEIELQNQKAIPGGGGEPPRTRGDSLEVNGDEMELVVPVPRLLQGLHVIAAGVL